MIAVTAKPDYHPSRVAPSHDEHAIAVTVEAVSLVDGRLIGPHDQLVTAERSHQNEQCRSGQVKVRHHGVNRVELVTGTDE
jgi:hypothetical protein